MSFVAFAILLYLSIVCYVKSIFDRIDQIPEPQQDIERKIFNPKDEYVNKLNIEAVVNNYACSIVNTSSFSNKIFKG